MIKAKTNQFIYVLVIATVLTACGVKSPEKVKISEYKVPDIKINSNVLNILSDLTVCNKSDSELSLEQFDSHNTITIQDEIETQEIVDVDCENIQTPKGKGPIKSLSQEIELDAPVELRENVNFAVIENVRTCSTQRVGAGDDKLLDSQDIEVQVPGQEAFKLPVPKRTLLGFSGKLKILLSDSSVKLETLYLNVLDNNNVIVVKYYGKCLKYKEGVSGETIDTSNDSRYCQEAELLAEKKFLLSALIKRPVSDKVYSRDICQK